MIKILKTGIIFPIIETPTHAIVKYRNSLSTIVIYDLINAYNEATNDYNLIDFDRYSSIENLPFEITSQEIESLNLLN